MRIVVGHCRLRFCLQTMTCWDQLCALLLFQGILDLSLECRKHLAGKDVGQQMLHIMMLCVFRMRIVILYLQMLDDICPRK